MEGLGGGAAGWRSAHDGSVPMPAKMDALERLDEAMFAETQLTSQRGDMPGETTSRAAKRICVATIRGAATGATIRGGFALISALVRKRGGTGGPPGAKALEALADAARWSCFLGSFSLVFTAVDEGVGAALGRRETKMWRTALAGLLAGPSLLITGIGAPLPSKPGTNVPRNTSLAVYLLARALLLLVRIGNKSSSPAALRSALAVTRWKHADVLCMCLASSQVLYAWIMMPHTLPVSYVKFLNRHAAKSDEVRAGIRRIAERQGWHSGPPIRHSQNSPKCGDDGRHCSHGSMRASRQGATGAATAVTEAVVAATQTSAASTGDQKTICDVIHPGQSCASHFVGFLPRAYMRALPVYVPIYIIPMLLVHRDKLLKKPVDVTIRTLLGIARSSLFLSCYCQFAWGSVCTANSLLGLGFGPTIALSAGSGLATLLEKKSRRIELAIYTLSRAIESFTLSMMERRLLPIRLSKRIDIITFSIASSVILHCYTHEREVFAGKFLNVFDWHFGNFGHETQQIKHVKSSLLKVLEDGTVVVEEAKSDRGDDSNPPSPRYV